MEEQGAFVVAVLVVEVLASRQLQTFRRAPALVHVLYGVRCVRAAHTSSVGGLGVGRLTKL